MHIGLVVHVVVCFRGTRIYWHFTFCLNAWRVGARHAFGNSHLPEVRCALIGFCGPHSLAFFAWLS